jgi:hypothetical protein
MSSSTLSLFARWRGASWNRRKRAASSHVEQLVLTINLFALDQDTPRSTSHAASFCFMRSNCALPPAAPPSGRAMTNTGQRSCGVRWAQMGSRTRLSAPATLDVSLLSKLCLYCTTRTYTRPAIIRLPRNESIFRHTVLRITGATTLSTATSSAA